MYVHGQRDLGSGREGKGRLKWWAGVTCVPSMKGKCTVTIQGILLLGPQNGVFVVGSTTVCRSFGHEVCGTCAYLSHSLSDLAITLSQALRHSSFEL